MIYLFGDTTVEFEGSSDSPLREKSMINIISPEEVKIALELQIPLEPDYPLFPTNYWPNM